MSKRITDLKKRRDQLNERIKRMEAREREKQRKQDTRRKIIAGALALEHLEKDDHFRATMEMLLHEHVTRDPDRALFNLPPLPEAGREQGHF